MFIFIDPLPSLFGIAITFWTVSVTFIAPLFIFIWVAFIALHNNVLLHVTAFLTGPFFAPQTLSQNVTASNTGRAVYGRL